MRGRQRGECVRGVENILTCRGIDGRYVCSYDRDGCTWTVYVCRQEYSWRRLLTMLFGWFKKPCSSSSALVGVP